MLNQIIKKIDALSQQHQPILLAIAGPPAAGKSTLAAKILTHYGDEAVILPMDGFHLDNVILQEKNLLARKGAPESFDALGFMDVVKQVAAGKTRYAPVFAPVFDRKLDLARAGAIAIHKQPIIIVEGNYLLFEEKPWCDLKPYWNLSIWLDMDEKEMEKRCIQRWLDHELSLEQAKKRCHDNDLANAKRIIHQRLPADISLVGS